MYIVSEQQSFSIDTIQNCFQNERYDQVVELINEVINKHGENGDLWYMLGYSNYQLEVYDEAEAQLIKAIEFGMDEEVVLPVLGHVYMELEQYHKAEGAFIETMRLNPKNAAALANYAYLLYRDGLIDKAKLMIHKAWELDKEDPQVLRYSLHIEGFYHRKGPEMIALEEYIEASDSELATFITLGVQAALQHKIKKARDHFRQALLLKPEDQNLLAILEEMETECHPLLAPNRLIAQMSKSTYWSIGIGLFLLLQWFGLEKASIIWLCGSIGLIFYTRISEPIVRKLRKRPISS